MSALAPEILMMTAILAPFAAVPLIILLKEQPNLREACSLIAALIAFGANLALTPFALADVHPEVTVADVGPGLTLGFEMEPLGLLFALVSSGLWILNTLYSIGYMRGHGEKDQTRFFALVAVALGAAAGVAYAADLFTMFIFYEVLTLSTYPLVAHKGDAKARHGANTYLGVLFFTSIGLFLPAIIWIGVETGRLDFALGGIFPASTSTATLTGILVLCAFGVGKAALFPVHVWLPRAMVAPTPVSALLHAVAVVKAGVFVLLKLGVYTFGELRLAETGASEWLIVAACVSMLYSGVIACFKDNLKARLAYSTVSQLAYVTLGVALAHRFGVAGAALQIPMHALGKITLFMCAGAILVGAHKTKLSEMAGLGRQMPWVFGAFFIAALSITGVPPMGGDWVKLYLMLGASESDHDWVVFVLVAGTMLAYGYTMPVVVQGWFGDKIRPPKPQLAASLSAAAAPRGHDHAIKTPPLCVIPPVITAGLCVIVFVFVEPIKRLLDPILDLL